MKDPHNTQPSIAHRLILRVGRRFGVHWVGDYELAVIYHLERYHTVKGPGFFWINPFTQTVRSVISVAPDFISITMSGIQTRDGLQVEVSIALAYGFDPLSVPSEEAALFVKWPRDVRRAIVTDNAQRALQSVMPEFYAEQVLRGEVFGFIEQKFLTMLTGRLQPLALKPLFRKVLQVKAPPTLQGRFEAMTRQAVDARELSQYEPYELTQVIRMTAIDTMKAMAGDKQYANVPDLTDIVVSSGESQPAEVPIPDALRTSATSAWKTTFEKDGQLTKTEAQRRTSEIAAGAYAVARLQNLEQGRFAIHEEPFLLWAGVLAHIPEGFRSIPIRLETSREKLGIEVSVHAEDMSISPTWAQEIVFDRNHESELVEFKLTPYATGQKIIRVEFYYTQHWLAQLKFEIEVVEAREPVVE